MSKETDEFKQLQKELLKHKYLYYIKDQPIITDYEYDMLEDKSLKMARDLGFQADKWEEPTQEERYHVHWMAGFDENHPLAKEVIDEVENG